MTPDLLHHLYPSERENALESIEQSMSHHMRGHYGSRMLEGEWHMWANHVGVPRAGEDIAARQYVCGDVRVDDNDPQFMHANASRLLRQRWIETHAHLWDGYRFAPSESNQ